MTGFFRYFPDMYEGSELSTFEYLGPLLIGLLVLITFYFLRNKLSTKTKRLIIVILGTTLAISEISDKIYVYVHLGWHFDMISLHLCSISAVLGVYLIFFNPNEKVFGVFFFWSLQGAIQALLQPTVTVGTEYYKYWQFFTHHVILVVLPITFMYFNNWIPRFKDLVRSYVWLVIVSLPVMVFNTFTGTGYMFISLGHDARPTTGSILDYLGPFPYYIITLSALAFVLFYITYLPIQIIYRKRKLTTN